MRSRVGVRVSSPRSSSGCARPPPPRCRPSLPSQTLVILSATAVDKKGQPVTNLRRQELLVLEEGRQQAILHFAEGRGGARPRPPAGGRLREHERRAQDHLRPMAVKQILAALSPEDQVAMAGFDSEYWGVVGLDQGQEQGRTGLRRPEALRLDRAARRPGPGRPRHREPRRRPAGGGRDHGRHRHRKQGVAGRDHRALARPGRSDLYRDGRIPHRRSDAPTATWARIDARGHGGREAPAALRGDVGGKRLPVSDFPSLTKGRGDGSRSSSSISTGWGMIRLKGPAASAGWRCERPARVFPSAPAAAICPHPEET